MQTIEARAILSAADRTGGIFAQIAAKIRGMNAAATTANRTTAMTGAAAARQANVAAAAGRSAAAANSAMMAASARILAPAAIAAGAGKAYKNFADTDLQIKRIGITADGTEEEVAGLSKAMRDLALGTGQSFNQVTKGLESLVAGGMDLKDALPAMPAIAKTAQAAGAEVEDMATTTLALNQNMKIATDRMQTAFDVLVKGGKAGKFELKDMARYIPSIAPAAVAAGMKGEEGLMRLVAAMQTVRNGTGTTEEAADSMLNIFAKMESEETAKKFKKFGVDLREEMTKARKEGKDLLEVFVDLSDKAIKGDLSKIPQLFSDMQFARGMRALLSYRDLNKKVLGELQNAAGSTQRDFEKIMNTPAIAMKRMGEAFDRLVNSAGFALNELGKKLGNKDGMVGIITDTAKALEKMGDKGPAGVTDYYKEALDKAKEENRDDEIKFLQERIEGRKKWLDEQFRGRDMKRPEIDPEVARLNMKMLDLIAGKGVGTAAQPITEEEIQKWRERDLRSQGYDVPLPMGDPRKAKGFAPVPVGDPRKQGYGSDMPPVQTLDGLNVEAKLTGEAEVKGQTEVKVTVEAGSELLRIVDSVKNAVADMAGKLRANGPGSTGRSSPDAAPSNSLNTGMPQP